MTQLSIGAAIAARVEETYEPNFSAVKFFPDWDPAVMQEHGAWLSPDHYDPASGCLKLSVHSWLLTAGGKRILIDACVGNHKPRAARRRSSAAISCTTPCRSTAPNGIVSPAPTRSRPAPAAARSSSTALAAHY
jgi:hypothetical protein